MSKLSRNWNSHMLVIDLSRLFMCPWFNLGRFIFLKIIHCFVYPVHWHNIANSSFLWFFLILWHYCIIFSFIFKLLSLSIFILSLAEGLSVFIILPPKKPTVSFINFFHFLLSVNFRLSLFVYLFVSNSLQCKVKLFEIFFFSSFNVSIYHYELL